MANERVLNLVLKTCWDCPHLQWDELLPDTDLGVYSYRCEKTSTVTKDEEFKGFLPNCPLPEG